MGNSTEFPDNICRNFYKWEDLIDLIYSLASFNYVETLQKEARTKIDHRIRVRQIRDCEGTHFTEEELLDLLGNFEKVCTNETIGKSEFISLLTPKYDKLLMDSKLCDRLYEKFDRNSDGVLDFREFCHAYSVLDRGSAEHKLRYIFTIFDIDKDGFIGPADLKYLLEWQYRSMEFSNIDEMIVVSVQFAFSEYDHDKDGKFTLEEFKPVVLKQPYLVQLFKLVDE